MKKIKKSIRLKVVPVVAILAVFWFWLQYGSENLWWWPVVMAIVLVAELRIYLKKHEMEKKNIVQIDHAKSSSGS